MLRNDLKAVSSILDGTKLFPSEMLSEMAEPYLSDVEPHIWLVVQEGPAVLGFAYCEPERMTDGTCPLGVYRHHPHDIKLKGANKIYDSPSAKHKTTLAM